jgi:hypothetical protein
MDSGEWLLNFKKMRQMKLNTTEIELYGHSWLKQLNENRNAIKNKPNVFHNYKALELACH